MRKIKKWHLWLIVAITLAIAVALICINLYVVNNTALIVLIVIDFIIMTFALNSAITMTVRFKPKPKKYPNKAFNYNPDKLLDNLLKQGFKENKVSYGNIYTKVCKDVGYKITIITSAYNYLNVDNEKVKTSNNKNTTFKNCTKFIGAEVFLDYEDNENRILKSIPDFSFQGKNIYYEAFYFDKETNLLHEPNIIKVDDEFTPYVNDLKIKYLLLTDEYGNNQEKL